MTKTQTTLDDGKTPTPAPSVPLGGGSKLPPPVFHNPTEGPRDEVVYAAWQKHMANGFDQNSEMFRKTLDGFMQPYWLTVRMYQVLFGVGILGVLAAAVLGVWQGLGFAVLFGGLSIVAFLAFFISQPLRALEQNLQFITWLGVIYNTYWARLMYATDPDTVQEDLEDIKQTTIKDLQILIDKQATLSAKRPTIDVGTNKPGG